MKIKILLLLTISGLVFAENEANIDTKEIIGSGIFSVNTDRNFAANDKSLIYLDNILINYALFEIIGSGYKIAFTTMDDVDVTFENGTINALDLITNIKGPVTSVSPLMVLEQPVLITSDTVKSNYAAIEIGQLVSLSGYLSANNSLKATKVIANEALDTWKVRGFASNVHQGSFKIGLLAINRNNETLINCDGFTNGSHVEVKMAEDNNYQAGSPIDTLVSIECLKLNLIDDMDGEMPSVIQGFISQTHGSDFFLNDISVTTTNSTIYVNGEKNFVDTGVNVEVQGSFDPDYSELIAHSIRFIDHRVEVTFPLQPSDVTINESITILGKTFHQTPQTKDSLGILANGLSSAIQVQIQGYVDSKGRAYISKLLDKGSVDYNAVSIRGGINITNNPNFSILNVNVDVSNSLIVNQGAGVISLETFFALVESGSQVEIKNAVYDLATSTMTGGIVTLKATKSRKKITSYTKEIIGSGIVGGFGIATISATTDRLFFSGFE